MADEPNNNLHIALFPWLAFGHLLPFLQLSICLAQRGHRITFISTPRNLQRLPKIPSTLTSLLTFISLTIPTPQLNNLPPNAESTSDISPDHHYLWEAFDALQHQLATFLQHSPPNLLIYDYASYWLPPIADKLNLPCVYFDIFNASTVSFCGSVSEMMREDGGSRLTPEEFTVPPNWIPFPSKLSLHLHEVPKRDPLKKKPKSYKSAVFRLGSAIQGCKLVAVRSCYEFEDEWLRLLQEKLCLKPVVPVGLLPPTATYGDEDEDERWDAIKEWLDKQREGSVVYVAFGSESAPSENQVKELAYGLELSGLPFLWVVRKPPSFDPELSILPSGFEERVKEKGIGYVTMEWVPQLRILGHRSVGGFLTHGGWSSIIEGIGYGVALIMLPFSQPQGLNCRLLESKKMGLEIPRDERDGSFDRNAVAESVRVLMVGEEGEIFRTTAKNMKGIFADRERHDRYINEFDRCLRNICYQL